MTRMTHMAGYKKNTLYTFYGVCRDYKRFVKKLLLLKHWYGEYLCENQAEVLVYECEPEVRGKKEKHISDGKPLLEGVSGVMK